MTSYHRRAVLAVLLLLLPLRLVAAPADLCLTAARQAASESGVPLSVLLAISRTETGRRLEGRLRPWPWTVNMEGEGRWFESLGEVLEYTRRNFARGARSFDTGCFQINYRWHHQHFTSLEEMFDPLANALYAARFLRDLRAETGDWSTAAGAYHSRTPEYAARYRKRFDALRAEAMAEGTDDLLVAELHGPGFMAPRRPVLTPRTRAASPTNQFPLLQEGRSLGRGSLVPLGG